MFWLEIEVDFLEANRRGGDSYKIDYSAVAEKADAWPESVISLE
jgi:hypothetical protein